MAKKRHQQNKKNSFEYINGLAIDQRDTKKHHQLISVTYDRDYRQYRLDYTIHSPSVAFCAENALPENFSELVNSRNEKDRSKANAIFCILTKNLTDNKDTEIFDATYKNAITCSFIFNPNNNFKIEDQFIRPSLARIEQSLSYEEANTLLLKSSENADIRLIHDFAGYQKYGKNYKSGKSNMLPFTEVMTQPTLLIQQAVSNMCLRDNIACVHRHRDFHNCVGSISAYIGTHDARALEVDPRNWVVPITTSKKVLSALNGMTFGYFMQNGENLFSENNHCAAATMVQRIYTHPVVNKGYRT